MIRYACTVDIYIFLLNLSMEMPMVLAILMRMSEISLFAIRSYSLIMINCELLIPPPSLHSSLGYEGFLPIISHQLLPSRCLHYNLATIGVIGLYLRFFVLYEYTRNCIIISKVILTFSPSVGLFSPPKY